MTRPAQPSRPIIAFIPPLPSSPGGRPSTLQQPEVLRDRPVQLVGLLEPRGVGLPVQVADVGALLLHRLGECRLLRRRRARGLELRQHVGRRALRRHDSAAHVEDDVHAELLERRHVRRLRAALLGRDGDELELARVDLALLREVRVGEVDVPAEDRVHPRREAFVRDVLELDPRRLLDQRREEVAGRGERRADRDLPGTRLRVGEQLGPGLPRRLRARREHRRGRGDQAHRLEVGVLDVGDAGVVGRVDVVVDGVQRVAVGGRVLRLFRALGARGAADIRDHDRLAEALLHERRERPEEVVGVAAGGPRHDQLDRAVGVRGERRRGGERGGRAQHCERVFSWIFLLWTTGRSAGESTLAGGEKASCAAWQNPRMRIGIIGGGVIARLVLEHRADARRGRGRRHPRPERGLAREAARGELRRSLRHRARRPHRAEARRRDRGGFARGGAAVRGAAARGGHPGDRALWRCALRRRAAHEARAAGSGKARAALRPVGRDRRPRRAEGGLRRGRRRGGDRGDQAARRLEGHPVRRAPRRRPRPARGRDDALRRLGARRRAALPGQREHRRGALDGRRRLRPHAAEGGRRSGAEVQHPLHHDPRADRDDQPQVRVGAFARQPEDGAARLLQRARRDQGVRLERPLRHVAAAPVTAGCRAQ